MINFLCSRMYMSFAPKFTKVTSIIDYSVLKATDATNFSSEIPYHMEQLIQIMNTKKTPRTILDMTAHVGGFSLYWAKTFPKDSITSVEIDKNVYNCLKYNIAKLKLKNITPINQDSANITGTFDFVYVDPPWGGPLYKSADKIQLFLGSVAIPDVIKRLFDNNITKNVFLKVPLNYDFMSLHFRYTVITIMSPNTKKSCPDYLLVIIPKVVRKIPIDRTKDH